MNVSMADLMAKSGFAGLKVLHRGEEVEGKIISITDNELILDLGAKVEGVLNKRDLDAQALEKITVGDLLNVYIVVPETEGGQAIVSLYKQVMETGKKGRVSTEKWHKVLTSYQRGSQLSGEILEINRGGIVVEVDHLRGFLPSSQLNLFILNNISDQNQLLGQTVSVAVIEVDPDKNRLIFSARRKLTPEQKDYLAQIKAGETMKGKIVAVLPFGLYLDLGKVEGMIFPQEVSWEPFEGPQGKPFAESLENERSSSSNKDLLKEFFVGQELEAKVIGIDETLGRVNLSLRQLQKDPFTQVADKYQPDDVVLGTISEVSQNGVLVNLKEGVGGFLPAAKLEAGSSYQVGQNVSFLVDSVDTNKRRINLAPFITSTKGLIYK